jgi:hypothetical protein
MTDNLYVEVHMTMDRLVDCCEIHATPVTAVFICMWKHIIKYVCLVAFILSHSLVGFVQMFSAAISAQMAANIYTLPDKLP